MTPETNPAAATAAPDQRPAASSSVLGGLRARRQAVVDQLHLDLAVPRYDPPIYVRFGAIQDHRVTAINKQFEKSKDRDRQVRLNAVALADCAIGVFEVVDGHEVSIDDQDRAGDWLTFDERLGDLLGVDEEFAKSPVAVIRALYATDGDIISTAAKLADWSGYTLAGVEEREGN